MLELVPAHVAALCLTIYWAAVVVKLIKLAKKIGKDPNALPREWIGIAMRGLWYPCIGVLLVALWLTAANIGHGWLLGWLWKPNVAWAWAAAMSMWVCVICTIVTFVCWRKMGRSWRIGIDPNEKLDLVSTGPYRFVRHPIYSLRMVINISAFVMAPTLLVLIAAGIDCILLQIEARREENYMLSKHGLVYATYKNSVGRFVPRVFVV